QFKPISRKIIQKSGDFGQLDRDLKKNCPKHALCQLIEPYNFCLRGWIGQFLGISAIIVQFAFF
ncbi:MAG: hypothetical protein Q4F28_15100, partial [Eubacteriales bacterium]|nr:hypothetical protein [Eubacteriales bacterium]